MKGKKEVVIDFDLYTNELYIKEKRGYDRCFKDLKNFLEKNLPNNDSIKDTFKDLFDEFYEVEINLD